MLILLRVILQIICGLWLIFIVVACAVSPPTEVQPTIETEITSTATIEATSEPEVNPTETLPTCADIDTHWGNDWPATLATLEMLIATDQTCGEEPLLSKKYAAHYIYAASLEESGDIETATHQYQAALAIDPNRQEALNALFQLDALPEPTPAPCLSTSNPNPDPAPAEPPDLSSFVTVSNDQLILEDAVFNVKGVNYYPRHTPWHRFLEESDPAEMAIELDLIKEAGFNTLRVFLWYEPLFTCQPEDAIPNEETFAKVDALLQLADERDLKLIVTLNDLPDLMFRPLYTDWEHYDAQTTYIVRRYRNEPAILAWDLRNEGDIDYGAQSSDNDRFNETEVLKWLDHTSQIVQENDPYHLITAGWWGDPIATAPYVDFLCFHQFDSFDTQQLQARIKEYQSRTNKPLILGEVGYHSWAAAAESARDEANQAKILEDVLNATNEQKIAGWIIWTAFDFTIPPGQPPNYEHFFGLWRSDLTPKPVLETLPLQ